MTGVHQPHFRAEFINGVLGYKQIILEDLKLYGIEAFMYALYD